MADNSRKNIMSIGKIICSIDKLLIEGKEQRLKAKLSKQIKNSIFTDDILAKLNECDFTGIIDEEESVVKLFDSIFPIFINDNNATFRLYKHKIEVDLSDDMKDRYIYMFSDGRLTSGLFQCFSIGDNEYLYGIKRIIDVIPLFKRELLSTLANFKDNIDKHNCEIKNFEGREDLAEKNYSELNSYLTERIANERKL